MCEVYPIKDNSVVEKMQELMIQDNNSRIHFLFTVGIKSGFRISDILNLTYEDIRGKTHFDVVEKKTKKRRTIAIHPAILAAFEKYDNGETGLLFTSNSNRNRGKAFSRIYVVNELKKYAELAGFKAPRLEFDDVAEDAAANSTSAIALYVAGMITREEARKMIGLYSTHLKNNNPKGVDAELKDSDMETWHPAAGGSPSGSQKGVKAEQKASEFSQVSPLSK